MGDCRYCGEPAGFLRRTHRECRAVHREGVRQVRDKASSAGRSSQFDAAVLAREVAEIANGAYLSESDARQAMADGWGEALQLGLQDGVLTRSEEVRLREFRDRLALQSGELRRKDRAKLHRAVAERLEAEARTASLAADDGRTVETFAAHLADSPLSDSERKALVVDAWETAVERSLEDGLLSTEEEHALLRYLRCLELSRRDVAGNGAYGSMVKAAIIREAAEGIVPNRFGRTDAPFNLMKSEKLVWLIKDVEYLEVKVRRERRGSSQGLTIRVAKGVYYRPSAFRSRAIEREETIHQDTGLLGVTTKHLYFHGTRKRFRIRYDRIVSFEPYDDGFGLMREAQSATPQTFRTGDGWFAYNLVVNLARHW